MAGYIELWGHMTPATLVLDKMSKSEIVRIFIVSDTLPAPDTHLELYLEAGTMV